LISFDKYRHVFIFKKTPDIKADILAKLIEQSIIFLNDFYLKQ